MKNKVEIDTSKMATTAYVKPFLKWLGGKSQLLEELENRLPKDFSEDWVYVEPFLGGGAMLFYLLSKYPNMKAVANDLNKRLITTYQVVKNNVEELIIDLKFLEAEYLRRDPERRASYFYSQREILNFSPNISPVHEASIMIFLNKTCFNGLYRENSRGEFNSPHGKYQNPTICNESLLRDCSRILQRVELTCEDYRELRSYAKKNHLFYFDPPYRPLSKTSAFVAYIKSGFNDNNQKELKEFCDYLHQADTKFMLSDSDTLDGFFDDLYKDYKIDRVKAARAINCKGDGRGKISELIISNIF